MGFCTAPGLGGRFQVLDQVQKDFLTVRNTQGWKEVVRQGGELAVL